MKNRILIVAAHPDDEILGCAGTVARLIKEGAVAYTLILGEGLTSRNAGKDNCANAKELNELKRQACCANKKIGVKEVYFSNFPDNQFDVVAILEIARAIEKVKNKVKPDIIFTHFGADLNIDHRLTYQAVITAARPMAAETVKEIYSFEVLSSTEWNFPLSFSPNVFFDISGHLEYKTKAMKEYKMELRSTGHPRSIEGIKLNAQAWGMKVGVKYAEAFQAVRIIK
ncbi:PIG-L family deacetylase [bacterium]|nr:MAG: PIG-L family deacetylase [bacterium]